MRTPFDEQDDDFLEDKDVPGSFDDGEYAYSFHPLHIKELWRYFYEVINASDELQWERAKEITADKADQRILKGMFEKLTELHPNTQVTYEQGMGFLLAAIAGYIHPWWYCHNGSLNRLVTEKDMPELLDLCRTTWCWDFCGEKQYDEHGRISAYDSGGIYIEHEDLEKVKRVLLSPHYAGEVREIFNTGQDLQSLLEAINYAQTHGTGLLEAKDIGDMFNDRSASKDENRRYPFSN